MKAAVLGANGMLGSAVYGAFARAGIEAAGFARPEFDAENPDLEALAGYDYIINCIGVIKPYIHEGNSAESARAVRVNSLFPHMLAEAAARTGARVVQIATDCVWDGARGRYVETDRHNALDIYGKTKSLGEVTADNFLNLRCSIVGREKKGYLSLLEWMLRQPEGARIDGYKNHFWNGVTTDAFANICLGIMRGGWFCGLQHVVPADKISKAGLLRIFASRFGLGDLEITDVDADEAIDRTLATLHPGRNEALWRGAGYARAPTIARMVGEIP